MGDTGQTAGPHAPSFPRGLGACLRAVIFDVDGDTRTDRTGRSSACLQPGIRRSRPALAVVAGNVSTELLAVTGGKERLRAYVGAQDPQRLESAGFGAWLARLHQRKSEIYAELVPGPSRFAPASLA